MRLPGYYKTNGRSVHLAGHLRHEAVFGMMSAGLLMLSSSARMFYSPFIPPVAPKRAPCGIDFPFLKSEDWDVYAAALHLSVILVDTCWDLRRPSNIPLSPRTTYLFLSHFVCHACHPIAYIDRSPCYYNSDIPPRFPYFILRGSDFASHLSFSFLFFSSLCALLVSNEIHPCIRVV